MIDKEIKKKITEDWLNEFPQLSAYAQNKLYKIVDCCIFGIELIKLPNSEEYRPHFVIYGLWKNEAKKCLDAPALMQQLYNKKNMQFNIPYKNHSSHFYDAVDCFNKQITVGTKGDVSLTSLFQFIDSRFENILVKSNSAEQAKLFELKFFIALFIGNHSQIQDILVQIQKVSKNWNMTMFEIRFGKFDNWLHGLQEKINGRNEFLKQVMVNKQDKKISLLKNFEIII